MSSCASCGSNDVGEDDCGGTVCTGCGTVVSTGAIDCGFQLSDYIPGNFVSNGSVSSSFLSSAFPKYVHPDAGERQTSAVRSCLLCLKNVCRSLALPTYVNEQADALFLLVNRRGVKYRSLEFKERVAACCVYTVCRSNRCPVSMPKICQAARIARRDLTRCLSFLMKRRVLTVPHCAVTDHIDSTIGHLGWSRSMMDKVRITVEMLKHLLSKDGVNPTPVTLVVVSAFLTWKGEGRTDDKSSYFEAFCDSFGLQHNKNYGMCAKVRSALQKATREVPWLDDDISEKHADEYVQDVIRHYRMTRALTESNWQNKEDICDTSVA